jgi:hypothetical protein
MEAFRRALQKACTHRPGSGGAGASVQFTLIQNRRHSDISGGFRKGSSQTLSASSSISWAVPKIKEKENENVEVDNLIVYRINEDEYQDNYRNFVLKEHDRYDDEGHERQRYWSLEFETPIFNSNLSFNETVTKKESPESITNTNISQLQETITTTIPYKVIKKEGGNESLIREGIFCAPTQGLYLDTDGQYKYSQSAVGTRIERSKRWQTRF